MGVPWRRRDDALAHLESRGLLAVEIAGSQPPQLGYRLRARGAELLEQRFYPGVKIAGAYLKACAAIREYLPDWPQLSQVEERLQALADRLETLRREEQLPREARRAYPPFSNGSFAKSWKMDTSQRASQPASPASTSRPCRSGNDRNRRSLRQPCGPQLKSVSAREFRDALQGIEEALGASPGRAPS